MRDPPPASQLFYRNTLREVSRLIDIAAAAVCNVVSEQLQRNRLQDRKQEFIRLRDDNVLIRVLLKLGVILQPQRDEDTVARLHFLDVVENLLVTRARTRIRIVVGRNEDNRQVLVNQGVRTVFHLTRGIALRMDVGELLQLQRPFQRNREMHPARKEQKVVCAKQEPRDLLHMLGAKQHFFHLVGQRLEVFQHASNLGIRQGSSQLAQ